VMERLVHHPWPGNVRELTSASFSTPSTER